jgi:hypothetical protein
MSSCKPVSFSRRTLLHGVSKYQMAGENSMNVINCSLPQILGLSEELGRSCITHRRYDIWTQISVEELEEKYNFKTKAFVGG